MKYLGKDRNFTDFHVWARGYCASTAGLDEKTIREYIRKQKDEEERQAKLPLGGL
jgi:putative transposase